MNIRKATAYHEAGHAVVARVLGYPSGSATIIANEAEMEAGHHAIADPWAVCSEWENRGRFRDYRQAFRARILILMAGREAEIEVLGHCQGGDGDDQHQIALTVDARVADLSGELWGRYEQRARRQTRRLIRKHRLRVERVANALLERGTLSGAEIDYLIA